MSYAARLRSLYPYKPPTASIDHLVIGGGVIGLSVAASLVNKAGKDRTTFLVERRKQLGQETTARNSEVIHSGIYYPVGSLKSNLCIRGRDLLYERCNRLGIGHRKCQKLIVATQNSQIPYLDHLQNLSLDPRLRTGTEELSASQNDSIVPAYFISGDEARDMEPDLGRSIKAALLVMDTGIVDSQGLVDSLEREIEEEDYIPTEERGEGVIVKGTKVVRIDREENAWVVQMESEGNVESVRAEVVVNAAGLYSTTLQEGIIPEEERVYSYFVKGLGADVSRLIYPCPSGNIDTLGTHLTLDLNGKIKFGPDVESIGGPEEVLADPDFWEKSLAPSESRLDSIGQAIQDFLPGIDPTQLTPDYSGIRPNIAPPNAGFSDFMIRHSPTRKGLIELHGFNSPGLTSSLAVGEYVASIVCRDVYGQKGLIGHAEGWD